MSANTQLCIKKPSTADPSLGVSARTMFEYDNHTNMPWNDPEYRPVRQYLDPAQQIADRRYSEQKKGQKDNRYVTRRGFYMDYHIKIMKVLPASCTYNLGDMFDQTDNKKESKKHKMDPKLMKYSYLDEIATEEKNRKKPGPGAYNLNKTEKEIKKEVEKLRTKKRFIGEKKFFYEDTQFLSTQSPGMGSHNPHLDVPHLKPNKTTHKFWIGKHKKEDTRDMKKNRSVPGPSNYQPCPLEYNTFQRTSTSAQKRKKSESKNGFGSDARFTYTRQQKKKILQVRPAPCNYNMQIQWKGKNMDTTKNNWIRSRSTGFSEGVYH